MQLLKNSTGAKLPETSLTAIAKGTALPTVGANTVKAVSKTDVAVVVRDADCIVDPASMNFGACTKKCKPQVTMQQTSTPNVLSQPSGSGRKCPSQRTIHCTVATELDSSCECRVADFMREHMESEDSSTRTPDGIQL